jgi:hypothetical protein
MSAAAGAGTTGDVNYDIAYAAAYRALNSGEKTDVALLDAVTSIRTNMGSVPDDIKRMFDLQYKNLSDKSFERTADLIASLITSPVTGLQRRGALLRIGPNKWTRAPMGNNKNAANTNAASALMALGTRPMGGRRRTHRHKRRTHRHKRKTQKQKHRRRQ